MNTASPFFHFLPKKPENGTVRRSRVLNGQYRKKRIITGLTRKRRNHVLHDRRVYVMPFIGDGVPGHFQPVLEVVDAKGKSLAFADDNYFDPDPGALLDPADVRYTLVVRDAPYRGHEFVPDPRGSRETGSTGDAAARIPGVKIMRYGVPESR
ncbi:MAG: hypothetical protein V8T87_04730 [Victivallales bacterium]